MKNIEKNKLFAVITGGSNGIGDALAREFVKFNIKVIVTSRTYQFTQVNFLAHPITQQQLDLTDMKSVECFFKWLEFLGNPIHFFVNNAGIGIFKPLLDIDISEWKSVIETNLTGSFLCIKHAYPFLKSANGARVINIGSISETKELENNSVYAASKMGLRSLSQTINQEWQKNNIFCTHVVLGAVATKMWSERKGFSVDDMLNVDAVAKIIVNSVINAKNIRLDTLEILPKKGIL